MAKRKSTKKIPKISVVTPVYNEEKFLEESIQSILNQTFSDFEFILVNDGSTDDTLKILRKYQKKDKRIRVIHNRKNKGDSKCLNQGLKVARGKYIAGFCGDDLSHPKRLEVECNYLENNPEIFLVGSSAVYIDEKGKEMYRFRKYNHPKMLAWRLRKSCSIVYPSILYRNEGILFDTNFLGATDYNFYFRLLKMGKNLTNLPPFLTKVRVHGGSMSVYNREKQEKKTLLVLEKFKTIKDKTSFFKKLKYSFLLLFHYLSTMKEKKIL